jgi:hypothetical protein
VTAQSANIARTRAYYEALAEGAAALEWDRWFTPDVIQEEFPNRLLPSGTRRDRYDCFDPW